ncbi:hypothetical protein ACS0TY_007860 [Phlomoides rotata]
MELVRQRAQSLMLCSFWHPDDHGRGCDNVSVHICIGLAWMHGGVMLMAEGLLGGPKARSKVEIVGIVAKIEDGCVCSYHIGCEQRRRRLAYGLYFLSHIG